MKIAVTATGPTLDSSIDPRFGRARFFVIFDTDTGEFTAHDNGFNVYAFHGAGIQTAQDIFEQGVRAVITGNIGPRAFSALRSYVTVYTGATGTVKDAIEDFKSDQLACAIEPNVKEHWVPSRKGRKKDVSKTSVERE